MNVVISGYGAITPLGNGVDALWSGLLAGRSGAKELDPHDPTWENLPIRVAAPVATDLESLLGPVRARKLDRSQQLALIATAEAWKDAGSPMVDPDRLAVVIGTGIGGISTLLDQDDILEDRGARRVSPRTVPMLMSNGASAQISIEYGARAGTFTTASACASGAEAITMAARLIQNGDSDVVIAGGVEAPIKPITLAAFAQAQALAFPDGPAEELSRPFDKHRRGFVLGEGSGIVVLESEDHAQARGARVRAVLAGWGISADAYNITSVPSGGEGQIRAMRNALKATDLSSTAIDHVNAHATGTAIGDTAEAAAIHEVFGSEVPVTAPKGALGHLVGGAGSVEAIITAVSVETGIIPATRNLKELDLEMRLNVVSNAPQHTKVEAAISNSFGFGGQNISIALRRP